MIIAGPVWNLDYAKQRRLTAPFKEYIYKPPEGYNAMTNKE